MSPRNAIPTIWGVKNNQIARNNNLKKHNFVTVLIGNVSLARKDDYGILIALSIVNTKNGISVTNTLKGYGKPLSL